MSDELPRIGIPKKGTQVQRPTAAYNRRDPASFHVDQIVAIHCFRPSCVITLAWQWVDAHHILGRGYVFGVRPDDMAREVFSSPYNFAPLSRDIHNGPARDDPEIRVFLLRKAAEKVDAAIRDRLYARTTHDEAFLAIAETWRKGVLFG